MNMSINLKTAGLYLKFIRRSIDLIICILFLITGVIITTMSYIVNIGQYGMGFALIIGSTIYLFLKEKIVSFPDVLEPNCDKNLRLDLIINIIFFICFSLSINILRSTEYSRPFVYFIIVAIGFFSLFMEVFNHIKRPFSSYFIIVKILLLSSSYRAGRFYLFPTIPGTDIHIHLLFIKSIIQTGRFSGYSGASQYVYSPLWHIFQATIGIISNLNLVDSLFFSIVVGFILTLSLSLFALVKSMFNEEIGLLSVLLANIVDMFILHGTTGINVSTFIYCFLCLTLFCISRSNNKHIYSSFIILFVFDSILTHQLSTFCYFVLLLCLLIGKFLFVLLFEDFNINSPDVKKIPSNVTINVVLLFLISMVFYWSCMGTGSDNFFQKIVFRLAETLKSMFTSYVSEGSTKTVYINAFSNFDAISNIMYNLGFSLLLLISIIGLFFLLNRKYRSINSFSYICCTALLFILIYPATYFGLDQLLIPHRFIPFLEFFMIIFSSFSVYSLYIYLKRWNKLIFLVIIFSLIFFMITTPYVNTSDPLYCTEKTYRDQLMTSELFTISWANQFIKEPLYVDPYINFAPFNTISWLNISNMKLETYPLKINDDYMPKNVLLRQYLINKPDVFFARTFGVLTFLNYDSFIAEMPKKYNLVFSTNTAQIYCKI